MTYSKLGIDGQLIEQVDQQTGKAIRVFNPTLDPAGKEIPVSLHKPSRLLGTYIIGLQGMGKSGLLEELILQDIKQEIGVCVLDPHGELVDNIIARLPDGKVEKVIYLDLAESQYFFGLNLFACPDPTSDDEIVKVVNQVAHVFAKAFGISMEDTPRIYDYLFNSAYTLIANPGYTLIDIPLVFTDAYRQKLLANVSSAEIHRFWDDVNQLPKPDQSREERDLLRRLNDFSHAPLRFIVGQSASTIDLRKIMDEGKILLVKLDRLLEQATKLVGSIIVALILNASASGPTKKQFHLYADEFQNFATEDFAVLLEEARKSGIGITMAHQNRAQLELSDKQADKNLKARTLSVGNLVVFRVPTDAGELAEQFNAEPPPGEPEHKPMMVKQFEERTVIHWEPPEAEEQHHQAQLVTRTLTSCLSVFCHACLGANPSNAVEILSLLEENTAPLSTAYVYALYHPDFTQIIDPAKDCAPAPVMPGQLIRYAEEEQAVTLVRSIPLRVEMELERLAKIYGGNGIDEKVREYMVYLQGSIRSLLAPYLSNAVYFFAPVSPPGTDAAYEAFYEALMKEYERRAKKGLWLFPTKRRKLKKLSKADKWRSEQHYSYWRQRDAAEENRQKKFANQLPQAEVVETKAGFWRLHLYPVLLDWLRDHLTKLQTELAQATAEEERLLACRKTEVIKVPLGYSYTVEDVFAHTELRGRYAATVIDARKTRYEEKPGPSRPVSDVRNEIANELVRLPKFTARIKLSDGSGHVVEHTIQTLKPERGLYGQALKERKERIRQGNIHDRYLRERPKVEAEIAQRQQGCQDGHGGLSGSQPTLQPQPAPSVARRAAPPCSSCGFSNRQGANFCNQCGAKL